MAHVRTFQAGPHGALSQKILNEIAAARVCLLNPEKKAAYDNELSRAIWMDVQQSRPESLLLASAPDPSLAARDRVRPEYGLAKRDSRGNDGSPLGKLLVVAAVLLLVVAAVVLSRKGAEPPVANAPVAKPPVRKVEPLAPKPEPTATSNGNQNSLPAPEPMSPGGEWISKDASYVVSSQYAGYVPLLTLLTDQGERHHGSMAFSTDPKRVEPPYIVVMLTSPCALQGLYIQNITSNGKPEHAAGLTMWVSSDQKDWQKVWTAERVEREWRYTLPKPVSARYVKIGLPAAGTLHLRTIKLFGQRSPGEVVDTRPATASVVPLHSDPASEWISKDASYVASSQYLGYAPGRALLTGTGLRHEDDSIGFYTNPKQTVPPYIVITLTSPCTLREFHIQNVTSGELERAAGLTMWVSSDQKEWQKVWTAERVEKEWRYTLPKPVHARYVRIGLPTAGALHLRSVELFGQRHSAPTGTSKSTATVIAQPTSNAQPVISKADSRSPVPDDDAQMKGLMIIKEVYGDEYESARTAEQKRALARKLFAKAVESGNDATTKYLLLRLAKDVAIQAVDGQTALAAVEKMTDVFQVDGLEMKCEVLTLLAKKVRLVLDRKAVARLSLACVDTAVAAERFDLATILGDLALSEATDARDFIFVKQVRARMAAVKDMATLYEGVQKSIETLKRTPDDPTANVAAGKYYCFYQGDWDKGLPMLALGSDAALKKLAAQDLQGSGTPDGQVRLGDGWWDLAASSEDATKGRVLGRAVFWYKRAMPQLTGLEKDKVEKRLQESAATAIVPDSQSAPQVKAAAGPCVGHFTVTMLPSKGAERQNTAWEFRKDGSVWEKDRQIGQWGSTESVAKVTFTDKSLGEASLRLKDKNRFVGTQVRANGEAWGCELQRVSAVATWKLEWPGGEATITLWSNGHYPTPDSPKTWDRKGSTLILVFSKTKQNTCTIAPDGKTFKGQDNNGVPVSGKLISEQ
jgi:hypothetical protein